MLERRWFVLASLVIGCAASPQAEDGEHDAVQTDGKGDSALSDADQRAALHVANALTQDELEQDAGLTARAARNVASQRAGRDGMFGTLDDRPFATLSELDAVAYVGPIAIDKLIEYADVRGWGNELDAYGDMSLLAASQPQVHDAFGTDFAVSGSRMAVSAPGKGLTGAVFFYDKSATGAWVPASPAMYPGPSGASGFGKRIALSNTTLAVLTAQDGYVGGSSYHATTLRVYAFDGTFWLQQLKESFSEEGVGAIALDGDTLAATTVADGVVHLWKRNGTTWTRSADLVDGTGTRSQDVKFGKSLQIDGDRVFVGSPGAHAVYVFEQGTSGWTKTVINSTLTTSWFGGSLAVEGDTLVVGAPQTDDVDGTSSIGSVSVYRHDAAGWNLESVLTAATRSEQAMFGRSVALVGDVLAVGADDSSGSVAAGDLIPQHGAVYLFGRDGGAFTQLERRLAPQVQANASFGAKVIVTPDELIVNAPPSAVGQGYVYLDD